MKINEALKEIASDLGEVASYLWDRGWAERNAGNCLIVNIESTPALEALDAILDVPELDAVLIGPHDLSCSLGIPEQYEHPRFEEAVCSIYRRARAKGVGAGIHFWSAIEREAAWTRAGANLLIHSSDYALFGDALRGDIEALKAAVGDAAPSVKDDTDAV